MSLLTLNTALRPLNVTDAAPVKSLPVIVTVSPTLPCPGEKDVTLGPCVMISRRHPCSMIPESVA